MEKKNSLFDELYDKTDEAIKKLKKPLVRKQLKRRMCAAYDDAASKKVDAEAKLHELRGNFSNFDVNEILEQLQVVDESAELQKMIANEYEVLFGQEIPKDD